MFIGFKNSIDLFKKSSAPISSSDEEDEPMSPASELQSILEAHSFSDGDLFGRTKSAFETGLKQFETEYPDTPTRKLRATKINETLASVPAQFTAKHPTAAFHREATVALLYNSTFGAKLVTRLKALNIRHALPLTPHHVMPRFLNMIHIAEGELANGVPVGLHFCPPLSAKRATTILTHLHPVTGVRVGNVLIEGKPKFSSLFPDSITTEDRLVSVIESGVNVASNGNFDLYVSQNTPPFYFETITKPEHRNFCVTTAYPIFHYSRFANGQVLSLDNNLTITEQELGTRLARNPEGIRVKYVLDEREIVDVAGLFPEQRMEQGIYLNVATGFFLNLNAQPSGPTGMNYNVPIVPPPFTWMSVNLATGAFVVTNGQNENTPPPYTLMSDNLETGAQGVTNGHTENGPPAPYLIDKDSKSL